MIARDGIYTMPILPKEMAAQLKSVSPNKADWPADFRKRYDQCHAEFGQAKKEFASWIRKDRDSRMNRTAKAILTFILDCLNCDTGRCDPGHQFIADELGISVRTVERTIPKIAASGWLSITRRGRTTTNFYRLTAPVTKVNQILDYSISLRDQRAEEREHRKRFGQESDPTEMADHFPPDPTKMADHDPTKMADHDPTKMAGKHMKGTCENEHVNEGSCSDGKEGTYTHAHARDDIPTDEISFGPWIKAHIPNPTHHREALSLLRSGDMTAAELRRLSA